MSNKQNSSKLNLLNIDSLIICICFLTAFTGFGYILLKLPGLANVPSNPDRTCISGAWKFALISTHILAFVVIPLAMRIFFESLRRLQKSSRKIFSSQLGLAFIMVAIASEIGWHVTQCWYYQNQFTMLNFMFYFFLIAAFALWADSLVEQTTKGTRLLNLLFAISLVIISILYPLGYEANNSSYKIPIYITLTLVFSVLTYRGYKLLKTWKIILFPLFSVGVNLAFIVLLYKFGGDPYTNPQVAKNALFHILHDLVGTEMGVIIFTALVYYKGLEKDHSVLSPSSESSLTKDR